MISRLSRKHHKQHRVCHHPGQRIYLNFLTDKSTFQIAMNWSQMTQPLEINMVFQDN